MATIPTRARGLMIVFKNDHEHADCVHIDLGGIEDFSSIELRMIAGFLGKAAQQIDNYNDILKEELKNGIQRLPRRHE